MFRGPALLFRALGASVLLAVAARGAEANTDAVRELIEQNRRLQEQVRTQQQTIDALSAKMNEVLKASERHDRELRGLEDRVETPASAPRVTADREHEVRVAGEAGVAFFKTGTAGQFPKDEFRVDDPTITLEAPVMKNVYFFTELKLLTRETNAENFQLGELYADFENVSAAWGRPGLLSFRAGRINVPFGEEYLVRGPVANPLISHSLSDIWGCDEGAEIYGALGPVKYVFAIQNGGASRLRDFNADKALVGRLSWDPSHWLHLSASAMRTGELGATTDVLSELWFSNGFFRSIGATPTTGTFWATLFEGDASARWKTGHLSGALGEARYDDSDTTADNSRRLRYGYAEVVQTIADKLYGAVRYSKIAAPRGYPLAGWGNMGKYFFAPVLTEQLERVSAGLGYRFSDPLVLKFEYSWETGRLVGGRKRNAEDFLGGELGIRF